MDPITKLISDLVANGTIADTTLLLLILGLMFWGYRNVLKPLVDRVKSIPTFEEVTKYTDVLDDGHLESLEDVSNKLEVIEKKLVEVEEYLKVNERDNETLKRDLETIKTILNQFQGHMMYNNTRGGSFGNRELK